MNITSFFANPSAWGVGLAIIFGAVWLCILRPLNWRNPWLWIAVAVGAIVFAPSITWIQQPVQTWIGTRIIAAMGIISYQKDFFWAGIPLVLVTGLIQEGAKLLPVVGYWLYHGRKIDPKIGLSVGAMAGAGFGIIEGQWALNSLFASGWNWAYFQTFGFMGIAGFWERFFSIGFHISSVALAGWGLAKGKGWQFYLLAAFLHFLVNYLATFYLNRRITINQTEILLAILATAVFVVVFWLRWRKPQPTSGTALDSGE